MPDKTVAVSSYDFKPKDRFLLDTNIWLLVYAPSKPNDSRVKIYSQAFKSMITAKSRIYIDVLVVSEFINRYARMKSELKKIPNFKEFRQSKAFGAIATEISDAVRQVLKHCKRIESGFETLEIHTLIEEYAQGKSDFNDQIIAAICKKERLKLVTDDGDFRGRKIFVLTANKELLEKSKS